MSRNTTYPTTTHTANLARLFFTTSRNSKESSFRLRGPSFQPQPSSSSQAHFAPRLSIHQTTNLRCNHVSQLLHKQCVTSYLSVLLFPKNAADNPTEKVLILTVDGRTLTGTLVSCDQVTNLVLADTIERIIREQGDDEPSTEQPHGLYLVRGDNVVVCGLVDEELDASIDWSKVRGDVIGSTKHV